MKRKMLPMNLQFFAEGEQSAEQSNEAPMETPIETPGEESQKDEPPKEKKNEGEPSTQELLVRIAKLERNLDKASSEAATYKKKWKESLSEKEQADMEKAEAQAAKDEEVAKIMRENAIFKSERKYLASGWTPEEAQKMALAEADGDEDERIKLTALVQARMVKEAVAKEIASRPDVNIGGGSSSTYTDEQLKAMSMTELSKLRAENPTEYERWKKL